MNKWLELSASLAAGRQPKKKNKSLPLHLNKDKSDSDLQTKDFISMVSNTAAINKKNKEGFTNEQKRKLPFKP